MSRVLLLIPVYNSEDHLPELIERVNSVYDSTHTLFVNDGSTDRSLEVLQRSNTNHISWSANQGKAEAIRAGIRYALRHDYEAVITLDSDLQHLPEELTRLLEASTGEGIVIGAREFSQRGMPFHRRLSNRMTSAFISIMSGVTVPDSQSGFRLINLTSIRTVPFRATGFQLESEMLLKTALAGEPIRSVPISTVYSSEGSSIAHLSDTLRFIKLIWQRLWY